MTPRRHAFSAPHSPSIVHSQRPRERPHPPAAPTPANPTDDAYPDFGPADHPHLEINPFTDDDAFLAALRTITPRPAPKP